MRKMVTRMHLRRSMSAFYRHLATNWHGYAVFLLAYFFYFSVCAYVGLGSTVNQHNFDCIFSLDSRERFNLTTNPSAHSSYVASFHPLFIPVTQSLYSWFSFFTTSRELAVCLLQSLLAASSVLFFYLSCLALSLPQRWATAGCILYGLAFSNFMYAVFYDAIVVTPATTTLAVYIACRYRGAATHWLGSASILLLSLAGLSIGFLQYYALLAASLLTRFQLRHWLKGAACAIIAPALCMTAIVSLHKSGWSMKKTASPMAVREFNAHAPRHFEYTSLYAVALGRPVKLTSIEDYVPWVLGNMIDSKTNRETLAGVIINPVFNYPLVFNTRFWSHNCTWFRMGSMQPHTRYGIPLLVCLVAGIAHSLRSKHPAKIGLSLAMLGYLIFFGYGYTTLITYLYAAQFVGIYVLLIVLGAHAVWQWLRERPKPLKLLHALWLSCMMATLIAGLHNNLTEMKKLMQYAYERFP